MPHAEEKVARFASRRIEAYNDFMADTYVYILRCSDGSYYTGTYLGADIATRANEHNLGVYPNAYTATRRPVRLVWSEAFQRAEDAIKLERQIKGWSRKKKEAFISRDWEKLSELSKSKTP